ncbi:MAG: 50S ribosomal protein L18e [Candidatus Bathyarchaeia archaeon]
MKRIKASNSELIEVIRFLKKQGREQKAGIWKTVAEDLASSRRRRLAVNVSRINRHTEKNDVVAVPGKVLGAGVLDHPVTVAAFAFSEMARQKIVKARGKCLTFFDLVKKNPEGSNVKIIG